MNGPRSGGRSWLDLKNVGPIAAISEVVELNIGHALIAHASFVGLQQAVSEMAQWRANRVPTL